MTRGFLVLSVLLLPTMLLGFEVDRGTTLNHQEITKRAFLNVTVDVCRAIAQAEGRAFAAPSKPYTVENILQSCQLPDAIKPFYQNMKYIQNHNIRVDKSTLYNSPGHHFHNEAFDEGRSLVVAGLGAAKASSNKGNYRAAAKQLGKISHTVQDFYSHSNWIEMGKDAPNANLFKGNVNVGNVAARARPTCRSCTGTNCNNILDDIISEQVLTSGFFTLSPSTSKPAGKCSHGGALDGSSTVNPKGGISKDSPASGHGSLHEKAANMATAASSQLLEDVRAAVGDNEFLNMIGAHNGRPLCFVVDTTGSMTDDIMAIKELTNTIMNNAQAGLQPQPSLYVLVTFKDPNYGPILRTTDPNEFKAAIYSMSASGGGDVAEMSMSGLQMALTGAPPGSDIFLFTDAPAKDKDLKNNVIALIEQTKSTVNIEMTGVLDSLSDIELYEDLARASGGQMIRVGKNELPFTTDVVFDSSGSSLVTILEATRNPGKSDNFTFTVDDTAKNVIAYITGAISSVTFVNPSADAQTRASSVASSSTAGNYRRIKLIKEVGVWQMRVVSNYPYTAKIVEDSALNFIYDFLGPAQGPLGGLVALESRPKAGVKGSVELTLIGRDTARVSEVSLLNSNGEVKASVTSLGNAEYLAEFERMPEGTSSLLVKGTTGNAPAITFQRMSSNFRTSFISVTADEQLGLIEPGATISIPFKVSSDKAGIYTVMATNDKGFSVTYPSRLELSGGSADGKVRLTAPDSAESGTEVTLTIQAENSDKTDMNYVVMSFIVFKKVTDFSGPSCSIQSQTSCSPDCASSRWLLYVKLSDGAGGAGVEKVYTRQGDGTMTSTFALGSGKMVTYYASCCSPVVEIVAVDTAGNVGSCIVTARVGSDSISTTTTTTGRPHNGNHAVSMSPRLVQASLVWLVLGLLGFHFTR